VRKEIKQDLLNLRRMGGEEYGDLSVETEREQGRPVSEKKWNEEKSGFL